MLYCSLQNGENENYDLPVASDEDFDVDPEPLYVNLEEDEGPYPTPPSPPKAQKPRFPSPWNLSESKALGKRKRNESSTIQRAPLDPVVKHFSNTLGLDRKGRSVKGVLQAGDRRRYKF